MIYDSYHYSSFEKFEQARKRFFDRPPLEKQIAMILTLNLEDWDLTEADRKRLVDYTREIHDEFLRAKAEHEEMCRRGEHGWQVVLDGGRAYRVCWWCGKSESLRQKVCPLCELRYYITKDETEGGCPECNRKAAEVACAFWMGKHGTEGNRKLP